MTNENFLAKRFTVTAHDSGFSLYARFVTKDQNVCCQDKNIQSKKVLLYGYGNGWSLSTIVSTSTPPQCKRSPKE